MDSVATRGFVKQFSHPPRNHTKVMLLDAGNKMFTDVALCTRVWPPPTAPILNATIAPLSTLSGFNMLTILSTSFAKYLKLVINQGPIPASNAEASLTSRRRLTQLENQIKLSVNESRMELMPDIMAKIKHFYSTSSENASATANTDNVLEYCKQFVETNFRLDANTTEYVCGSLLFEGNAEGNDDDNDIADDDSAVDAVSEQSASVDASSKQLAKTSVVRSRCPVVVEWYALFDFIISTASIVSSSGKAPTVVGDADDGGGGGGGADGDDDDDFGDIEGAAVEYNLLEYDTRVDGFAWPPVLRLKPFESKRSRSGQGRRGGNSESEQVSRGGTSSSIGRVYSDWMSGGLNIFWQCGSHCWTMALLIGLMLLMSVFGSIVAVIAIRYA